MAASDYRERLEATLFRPLFHTTKGYYALVLFLSAVVAWGVYAYTVQLRQGLIVTGMRDVVMWGVYITNFVFFIGISHAGTLISAILRVTHAGWRTPITRMAEAITVVALLVGASQIFLDMGRIDRILNVIRYGRFQSPLVWDVVSITTYLTGSLIYLYIPMIPDIALMRDRLGAGLKKGIYTIMALGWTGTENQKHRLEKAIGVMAIVIIPVAVSVHTVVSWVFAMTLRPGWNSTLFGPYFVVGAIFSGIASIIIVMAIFRKLYHLEEYITIQHFKYLGYLLLVLNLAYIYFTVSEYLTVGYKLQVEEKALLTLLLVGKMAPWFWFFVVGGMVLPAILIVHPKTRNIKGLVFASILVNVGMWVKRFVIVVPTLETPLMPFDYGVYHPTWVEWSLTAASFAAFTLAFTLFAKLFPIISVWEVAEGAKEEAVPVAQVSEQPALGTWST
ncbi:MAG: polysulfide reductase NrfD [Chloroflexi bacterium]|nr:polysulfide reductase NrfD [Chloroflexota bacterium]